MKYRSIIATALIGASLLSGCKDDFSDINTDSAAINKGNITYLFTEGLQKFEPAGYLLWFYNGAYMTKWSQAYVSTSSNVSEFNVMGEQGGQGGQTYDVLKVTNNIKSLLKDMTPAEAAQYNHIIAMLHSLQVYLGIFDTDMTGDYAYTEACMALYTDPAILAPKYESVESLYGIWLTQLDEAIASLTATRFVVDGKEVEPLKINGQDFVYNGDAKKWAKFANSLKLKIAVRLLHQNKTEALAIAKAVVDSPAGILSSLDDDFVYCRGTQEYHFGDNVNLGIPSKQLADFLIGNKDPRARFFYQKNDFNAKVVQTFIEQKKALPSYINELVVLDEDGNFKEWKAPGEPWVRYFGAPIEVNASQNLKYTEYFDATLFKIKIGDKEKTYQPLATFNAEMVRGQKVYTFPDAPNVQAQEDITKQPWHGLFYSTAEANLYLAELSQLGAEIEPAETYYNKAVEMSVRGYDNIAGKNKIPYYITNSPYYKDEESIVLKNNEIGELMQQDAYKFTGSQADKLEKIYIQQYIHFINSPTDLFVTVRRSGIPKRGSQLIAWEKFSENTEYAIPRRFEVGPTEESDLMYTIKTEAYKRQGFTEGRKINPQLLNTERVWQDKGAPNFGEGPNF